MIDIRVTSPGSAQREPSLAGSRQRRINDLIAYGLIAFIALVPIPLGANRPFFWAVSAVLVGIIGLLHAAMLFRAGEAARMPLSRFPVIASLWAAVCIWLVAQMLPVGGFTFANSEGAVFETASMSLAPGETAYMLVRMATYGLFFYLVLQIAANRSRADFGFKAIFVIVVAYSAYGLVALTQFGDTLLFFEKWAYQGSATGTFVNRNSYATFLAFGLVAGVILSLKTVFEPTPEAERRVSRSKVSDAALYGLGTVFIAAALAASQSRMGLAAGVAGSAAVAMMAGFKLRTERPAGFRLGLILAIALFVVAFAHFGAGTLERLGNTEQDFDVRAQLYAQVLQMISERPLLGFGGGSFETAYPLYQHAPVSPDRVWDKAHSTYLTLWTELGVVFGTLPILAVLAIVWRCMSHLLNRQRDFWLPLGAIGIAIVAALHSLVDFSLEIQANTFYFLAILGLGFAQYKQRDRV
ncbi:O-antigen ligase family protein [Pelagibacterium xiamenense]|uniref:O-antigen ligase family protein n=1 Tax=Pelagibacterium xiamenense TaxID=2901140 RepID=UPI001E30192E|nr:O-antigen ligase family protein [Pelagibacterium xiamenense]MCD7059670.1 O-antigen ligase family protein [Pelagibacterium xiamenense]